MGYTRIQPFPHTSPCLFDLSYSNNLPMPQTRIKNAFTDLPLSNTRKAGAPTAKRAAKRAAKPKARKKALPKLGQPPDRRPRIQDEFTHLSISRQRKYQLRKKKEQRCLICGKPVATTNFCLDHAVAARERQRKAKGTVRRVTRCKSYLLQKAAAGKNRGNS